jgi:hypothetical protein
VDDVWVWGAQIISATSSNVEIHHNTVAWGSDGISVVSQNRRASGFTDKVNNVFVHDNTIVLQENTTQSEDMGLGWAQDYASGGLYEATSNNRGANNLYWFDKPDGSIPRYKWSGNYASLSAFNATPGEEGGRYMTTEEKDAALMAAGIPTTP